MHKNAWKIVTQLREVAIPSQKCGPQVKFGDRLQEGRGAHSPKMECQMRLKICMHASVAFSFPARTICGSPRTSALGRRLQPDCLVGHTVNLSNSASRPDWISFVERSCPALRSSS